MASVSGVRLDGRKAAAYASMCGFRHGSALPVTYPHVLAMPLHLRIFADRQFPLRPMGLIHLSNVIECPGELAAGMRLDIEVAARHYQSTDTGLTFDIETEITGDSGTVWRETCVFMSRRPEPLGRTGGRPPRPPKAPKDSRVLAELDVSL
jgi:hypothetical protein